MKELITLTNRPESGDPVFVFPLTLQDLNAGEEGGGIVFKTQAGEIALEIPPGFMEDARGERSNISTRLISTGEGVGIELRVDGNWLRDESRAYPVQVDPTVYARGRDAGSEDGYISSANTAQCYNGGAQSDDGKLYVDKIGYDGGHEYVSFLKYNLSSVSGRRILSGHWNGYFYSASAPPNTPNQFTMWRVTDPWSAQGSQPPGCTLNWTTGRPNHSQDQILGNGATNQWVRRDMTSWVVGWAAVPASNHGISMDTGGNTSYFSRLAAHEMSVDGVDSYIEITHNALPVSATPTSPSDSSVTITATPTLSALPGTDADPGTTLRYWFKIATGTDASTGAVVSSGWLNSSGTAPLSWTVPAGSLVDGGTYYWKVITSDGTEEVSSEVRKLRINLRLGDQQTSPYDDVGVAKVNLASGNLSLGVSSPAFPTVGGQLGLSFSHNSLALPAHGLKGAYFNGDYRNPFPAEPVLVRRDQQVSFNWGLSSPGPAVGSDQFLVRWTGYLTVPYADGAWYFYVNSDDGVRLWINGQLYIDAWYERGYSLSQGPPLNLASNQTVEITLEYFEWGGPAAIELGAAGPVSGPVPSSWLSTTPQGLPQGWSLSSDAYRGLLYREALIFGESVILLDSSGAPYEYKRSADGLSFQPIGTEAGVLTPGPDGGLILQAPDGLTYRFDRAGRLLEARSSTDDVNPASPTYSWDGTTGRLSTITDPVSGRSISLRYVTLDRFTQTDPNCPSPPSGFNNPPNGYLCKVTYWDGTQTNLFYVAGQLARVENPGSEITDFGYSSGKLYRIRTPLAADLIAAGKRSSTDDTTRFAIVHDSAGRVSSVTYPAPASGEARPRHWYTYESRTTTKMQVDGLSGVQRTITLDDFGRVIADADAAGNRTDFVWDANDRLRSETDPTLIRRSTVYDSQHRPVEIYGPAPSAWFGPDDKPLATFASLTPRETRAYDEGITGLAAAYWPNRSYSGAVKVHETVAGSLVRQWGSGSPSGLGVTDNWAGRFTGEIYFPSSGSYRIEASSDDGVRVFIDDKTIIDSWVDQAFVRTGTYAAGEAGWKRIRIDYYEASGGAGISLYWIPPAGSSALVPGSNLRPAYGLVTSRVDPDLKATANEYGSRPELGLLTASVIDPGTGKLNLRTTTEYNDSYFRRSKRTLPKGDQTAVGYTYYGSTEARANPCVSGSAAVNQGGALKIVTQADPDGSQTAFSSIVTEFVYDQAGRVVAEKVSGDTLWTCTGYDSRGRVKSVKDRAGVEMTATYSGATTTWNFFDSDSVARSTVEELDLLGRLLSYTDEHGTATRRRYDQVGRLLEVHRKPSGRPEALITGFAYDTAGRVRSLTDFLSSASGRISTFEYDAAGRLKKTTRPNGVVSDKTYDPNHGRLDTISHVKGGSDTLSSWDYDRSPAGRVTREMGGGRTRDFAYDGAARLTSVSEGAQTRNYSFDANSNRCAMSTNCTTPSYEYHFDDRIKRSPLASGYTYDNRGNVTGATPTYPSSNQNRTWPFSFSSLMPNKYFPVGVGQNGTLNASLSWSTPFTRSATNVSSLNPSETRSFPLPVDQESFISSNLTWSAGSYPQTFSDPISVPAASSATKEISFDAPGDLSASMEWDPVSKGYSHSGEVTSTSDHPVVVSGNGNMSFTLTWPEGTPTNPNLDLLLLDSQGLVVARSTRLTGNSETVSYDVRDLHDYPSSSNYTLRVLAVGPGSSYDLNGMYPVSPTFDLQLESSDGQVLAASSLEPGIRKRTLSYPAAAAGTYRYRILSSDEGGTAILSETHPTSSHAPLTLVLKDPSGIALKTFTSDSATIQLSYQATEIGEYALEIRNESSSVPVPFLALPWSVTALKAQESSGGLAPGQSATHEVTADAAGYVKSSVTWAQGVGGHTELTTGNVGAGQIAEQTISPSAAGDISVELDWSGSSTSGTWQRTIGAVSSWDKSIVAGASGTLTANLSWPETLPNPDLDLYLIDQSTGGQLAASEALTGNTESISYQVSGVSYPSTKEYVLRVKSKGTGSSFTLSSTWPVTADLDLELYNPSGTKIGSSYSRTNKPETISALQQPSGNYKIRVISANHSAPFQLTSSYAVLRYAEVGVALKDQAGNILASTVSSSGQAEIVGEVPGAGTFLLELVDKSTDLGVPSYEALTWTPRADSAMLYLCLVNPQGSRAQPCNIDPTQNPKTLQASVTPGTWKLEVGSTAGWGDAVLTATYPGGPAKEEIRYDSFDHATYIDDGTNKVSETLSPSGRVIRRKVTEIASGVVLEDTLYGYDSQGDSPAYSTPAQGTPVTTFVTGPSGLMMIDVGGSAAYALENGHGDIIGTVDSAGVFTTYPSVDEFGGGTPPATRLGWLGSHLRFNVGGGLGLYRMGVRLYDPRLGRFLQRDPVEGGSANDYDYAYGDPCNNYDLDGRLVCPKWLHSISKLMGLGGLARSGLAFLRGRPKEGMSNLLTGGYASVRLGAGYKLVGMAAKGGNLEALGVARAASMIGKGLVWMTVGFTAIDAVCSGLAALDRHRRR